MKTMTKLYIAFCFLFSLTSAAPAAIPDTVLAQKKAVVTVLVYEGEKQIASGSGFIIEPDGVVVTNYHVISPSLSYGRTLLIKMGNGAFFPAEKLIAADEVNDIAIIKVTGSDLPSVKLAHGYNAKQGEDVVVIGSPLGLETTVSQGIISNIRGSDELLQITAPISQGSSGSPVFNMKGEVIGIATLIIQGGQNVNFAIPAKYIANLKPNLNNIAGNTQVKSHDMSASGTTNNKLPNGTAKEWFDRAEKLIRQNRTDDAIEAYGNAIALDANNAVYYEHRAMAFRSQMNYFIDKDKHNETFPKDEAANAKFIYDNTVNDYSSAIKLMPNNYDLYLQRAELYKIANEDDEDDKAISDYSKAIQLMPNNTDIYLQNVKDIYLRRAKRYEDQNNYDKAISDYTKLIEMNQNEASYYYVRANMYISKAKYGLIPPLYYANKCDSNILTDDMKVRLDDWLNNAHMDYYKATSLNPREPEYFYSLGHVFKLKCNYQEAIKYISKAISINPQNIKYYSSRERDYYLTDQFDNAIKDCDKMIGLEPNSYNGYSSRGDAYAKKGSSENAIKDFSNAISLDPQNTLEYWARADAYMSLNQIKNAKADYEKACNDGWKDACIKLQECKKDEERGDRWVLYGSTHNTKDYYDKSSIKVQYHHVIVWTMQEYEDISEEIKYRAMHGADTTNSTFAVGKKSITCCNNK